MMQRVYHISAGLSITRTVPADANAAVTEGSTVSYEVKLTSKPLSAVTVTIAVSGGDLSVSAPAADPHILTFNGDDWDTAQTVTILVTDDKIDEGTGTHTASWTATPSSDDPNYASATVTTTTSITIQDTTTGIYILYAYVYLHVCVRV